MWIHVLADACQAVPALFSIHRVAVEGLSWETWWSLKSSVLATAARAQGLRSYIFDMVLIKEGQVQNVQSHAHLLSLTWPAWFKGGHWCYFLTDGLSLVYDSGGFRGGYVTPFCRVAVKPGLWTLDWTGLDWTGSLTTISYSLHTCNASTWTVYEDQLSNNYSVWS